MEKHNKLSLAKVQSAEFLYTYSVRLTYPMMIMFSATNNNTLKYSR